ncbi:MAG: hypothetical protein AB9903_13410 [Vulcanimicrobiota bacterium]
MNLICVGGSYQLLLNGQGAHHLEIELYLQPLSKTRSYSLVLIPATISDLSVFVAMKNTELRVSPGIQKTRKSSDNGISCTYALPTEGSIKITALSRLLDHHRSQEIQRDTVVTAVIDSAKIISLRTDEGICVIKAAYMVRNSRKQYLSITLPRRSSCRAFRPQKKITIEGSTTT